ncbi:hypothetical protein QN277_023535 [Acacia crassicarpa]|uniref:E3 ubiquitin protein ligase n=1 Tax=Acacia crassicarpa TaxID=499986 RepID=A0AAE1MRQ7_9FABA|nr:hypothetical protein QN277_023535 [Acacia crassicarpa]
MGSMGEPDRKRRHFSSLSPTAAAATAKKLPFLPISEDKKLDIAVLQFQNQKLTQKLETQKLEYTALENKFFQLKDGQHPYDSMLTVVKKSWEQVIDDLVSCSTETVESRSSKLHTNGTSVTSVGCRSTVEDDLLSRLEQTGATESSSSYSWANQMEEQRQVTVEKAKSIMQNIVAAINNLWCLKDGLHAAVLTKLPGDDGMCGQKSSIDLNMEVRTLRSAFTELHLKHKSLASEFRSHQDFDAKNKVELKRLKGELASTVAELEESNHKLATLKAERDAAKGAVFPVLNVGTKHAASDKIRDKQQKDLQEMESSLKELLDQESSRLMELKNLHEERIRILQQICDLQNTVKNLKCITSSHAFQLARDQIEQSKVEVLEYQTLFEKLQVEKDNLAWREREWYIKSDLVDVFQRSMSVVESKVADLGTEIKKKIEERNALENKLQEAAGEQGRKQIIADFKSLLSSFPEEMGSMQSKLSKYKEAASDIHSLRADVQSLSSILERKIKQCDVLSHKSADQLAEIQRLLDVVNDLRESELELKLILEMYRRESIDSRDIAESRDSEYRAWAHVQSLKSSLGEHNLETRVKTANEAEARSQQRLATAEAEIVDLRQKLDASKREKGKFSDVLKSKSEEIEAYLSEIETIGQAYDDMQTQNQHLLHQITERDDYNIKLVLEGVRARQKQESLIMEKQAILREIQQSNASLNFYDMKAARIDDQLKLWADQCQRLEEDKVQSSVTLENTQRRLLEVTRSSQQARETVEEVQSKVGISRVTRMELQVDLERERFARKRLEEELEIARRKVSYLQAQIEGSSVIEKLQQELGEYREIVKCSVCQDRTKEVVITKCYHLVCNPCIQKVVENKQRKCPLCAASFGPNDVKPIYL